MPLPEVSVSRKSLPWVLAALLLLGLSSPAPAVIETYEFSDPAEETRYQNMIAQLRCLVCQNQNLADSNADLAKDLRARTYQMIVAGNTDDEIAEFMTARYGDFVLYRPPLRLRTALLWLGPFAILLVALVIFFFTVRKSRTVSIMSEQERAKAARLLDNNH